MKVKILRAVKVVDGKCIISLSQGKVAYCDTPDYALVSQHNWCAFIHGRTYYALTHIRFHGMDTTVLMHRLILGIVNPIIEVDHRDGCGFNNYRSNLRVATKSQNQMNSSLPFDSSSGFKGVYFNNRLHRFQAKITDNGNQRSLGYFESPILAAKAYNEAAVALYGCFARLNSL